MSGDADRWMHNSGETGFERYNNLPSGRTEEMGNGTLLPMADHGDVRLNIEQDDVDGDRTRELILRQVAHMSDLRYILHLEAQLAATFEHPVQLPRAAGCRCIRD